MNPKNAEAIQKKAEKEEQRNQNKAGYTFKKYFMEDLSPNLPIITFHVSGLLRSEYLCPVPPHPQVMRKSWCPRMVSEGESSGSWWDHEGGALLTGTPAPRPFHHLGTQQEGNGREPGRGPSLEHVLLLPALVLPGLQNREMYIAAVYTLLALWYLAAAAAQTEQDVAYTFQQKGRGYKNGLKNKMS